MSGQTRENFVFGGVLFGQTRHQRIICLDRQGKVVFRWCLVWTRHQRRTCLDRQGKVVFRRCPVWTDKTPCLVWTDKLGEGGGGAGRVWTDKYDAFSGRDQGVNTAGGRGEGGVGVSGQTQLYGDEASLDRRYSIRGERGGGGGGLCLKP